MIERIRPDGARIRDVVNEVTGRKGGITIEHPDGRVSAVARPGPTTFQADQVAPSMSTLHKMAYDLLRTQGYSHERAVLMMGVPHAKVTYSTGRHR